MEQSSGWSRWIELETGMEQRSGWRLGWSRVLGGFCECSGRLQSTQTHIMLLYYN